MKSLRLFRHWEAVLTVMLLLSVALNVALARRVTERRREIAVVKAEARLNPGDTLPSFAGTTIDGSSVAVNYARMTVFYIITPECRWCIRNTPNINALAREVGSAFEFIGISLTPASSELISHVRASQYQFPILTQLPAGALLSLKISGTPQTVVVSTQGQVVRAWTGAFDGRVADDVEAFFNIRLPGLTGEPERKN